MKEPLYSKMETLHKLMTIMDKCLEIFQLVKKLNDDERKLFIKFFKNLKESELENDN